MKDVDGRNEESETPNPKVGKLNTEKDLSSDDIYIYIIYVYGHYKKKD